MGKLNITILALLIGFCSPIWGEEKVAETLENVDLLIEDLKDKRGDIFGEAYFAKNRNDYSIRISIRIIKSENVKGSVVPYTIVLEPQDRVELGSVVKVDSGKDGSWNYEWEVEPDLQSIQMEKLAICIENQEI